MPGSTTARSPAGRAAAWLAGYERNRAAAGEWIHESWLPAWLAGASTKREALSSADSVDALMQALCLPAPDMEAVFDCAGARPDKAPPSRGGIAVALLPVPDQLRVLRLRSLMFRRGEVRRVVDLERRERLAAMLGEQGNAQLRWLQSLAGAPEMPALARAIGAPLLDTLDAAAIAWEGYCLFVREGALVPGDAVSSLLRLALPRALQAPSWLARCAREIDADGGERVFNRLPTLFPEHAWSFGCETQTPN